MKSMKSMKSLEISEIRVNSTDFEIRTPFWGVSDPSHMHVRSLLIFKPGMHWLHACLLS